MIVLEQDDDITSEEEQDDDITSEEE